MCTIYQLHYWKMDKPLIWFGKCNLTPTLQEHDFFNNSNKQKSTPIAELCIYATQLASCTYKNSATTCLVAI